MTLTQDQVIEAMTRYNSELEKLSDRVAIFIGVGFVSGFVLGVSIAFWLWR